jgi:hypothetical protein
MWFPRTSASSECCRQHEIRPRVKGQGQRRALLLIKGAKVRFLSVLSEMGYSKVRKPIISNPDSDHASIV